jgi:hypothetical protein
MANSEAQRKVDERARSVCFASGCPECGEVSGSLNTLGESPRTLLELVIDRCLSVNLETLNHWFVCNEHETKWSIGANLFSRDPEHDTDENLRANAERLKSYVEVEPLRPSHQEHE